jgi:hypothetical protein
MKRLFNVFLYFLIVLIITSCYPASRTQEQKIVVSPLSDTIPIRDGSIVYGLPRTVFKVTIDMEKTVRKPGPYAKYASDLLGLNDVTHDESEEWSIDQITVKSSEEIDPSELYIINSNSLFQTNVLKLKKEGLILDLSPSLFNPDETVSKSIKVNGADVPLTDLGADEYFISKKDTLYRRVKIDSTFMRIPYIVEKKKILTTDQLAEKAAKRLMELRDGKHLILTGEATVYPQNDAAIVEMNRLEKEYLELFTGKLWKEKHCYIYEVIPDKDVAGKVITIANYSSSTGLSTGPVGGTPVTFELIPEKKTKDLLLLDNKQMEVKGKSQINNAYDRLYYRVPDIANLIVKIGNENLMSSRKLVFQFGEIIQLPANYLIGK